VDEYLSEKEQWEAIRVWLRENGLWIVAGVAVGAAILGGWRWYQDHLDQRGVQAGAQYTQLLSAFGQGDRAKAFVLLGQLERDFSPSPYVDQGKLAAARVYVESGELDKAAGELQSVADRSKDSELALLSRLRLARVLIAQRKPDEALTTLNGVKPGAFAARYHEVRGDALYAKGDKTNALKEYVAAKMGDFGNGLGSNGSLDLKIADLTAEAPPAASVPVANAAAK